MANINISRGEDKKTVAVGGTWGRVLHTDKEFELLKDDGDSAAIAGVLEVRRGVQVNIKGSSGEIVAVAVATYKSAVRINIGADVDVNTNDGRTVNIKVGE